MGANMRAKLEVWDKVKSVPKEAQKPIRGGRLSGMTDISPQWRYHKMTEVFGPVGIGWKYTIDRQWVEEGPNQEKCAMTNISLYIKNDTEWSDAICGTGGSALVAKEKGGMYTSDEAFKMSLTDALSVAMKMLGVGAVIYSGGNDYSKYTSPKQDNNTSVVSDKQASTIRDMIASVGADEEAFCKFLKVPDVFNIPASRYESALSALKQKGVKNGSQS